MGNPFGLGAGLAEGLGQFYSDTHRAQLEQELQERAQYANLVAQSLPNLHPENQLKATQSLATVYGTPIGKKPKYDMSWSESTTGQPTTPPPGFQIGTPSGVPTPSQAAPALAAPPGSTPAATGAAPPNLQGAGLPPIPSKNPALAQGGGPSTGTSAPATLMPPPQYTPTLNPTGQTTTPSAGPPSMQSAFYLPEERAAIAASAAGAQAQNIEQAQIAVRERLIQQHPDWNFQQIELAMGHQPISTIAGAPVTIIGPDGNPIPAARDRYTGQIIDPQTGAPIPNAVEWKAATTPNTPFKLFEQTEKAAGTPPAEISKKWNTTYAASSGVRTIVEPDGSIAEQPVQTGTTTTRGAPPSIAPPPSGATGNAKIVGGRALPPVVQSQENYNASQERYAVMQDSLSRVQAAAANGRTDQQAELNLVANHIGMTMGLQKGARINQATFEEALNSAPWLARIGAKFDDEGYLSGVTLTPNQMQSMIELAKTRMEQDQLAWQREVTAQQSGFGLTPKAIPPPPPPPPPRKSKGSGASANNDPLGIR